MTTADHAEAEKLLDEIGVCVRRLQVLGIAGPPDPPTMSEDLWSVFYRGTKCDLRSGILGRILDLLIAAKGQRVEVATIAETVGGDILVPGGTVRVWVARLRGRLMEAGMDDLKAAIVWDDPEAYKLRCAWPTVEEAV